MRYIYIILALILITIIAIYSLEYWQDRYPLFLGSYDIAYHANAAAAMERLGGWSRVNFWAGTGDATPNTYFPFLHMVSILLLDAGAGQYFLTYWWSWLMLPLSFAAVLIFAASVYGSRIALYLVLLMALSPVWLEKQWGLPPQALVFVLTPFVFLALAKKKYIAVAILTACCMATHFLGAILVPTLFLYALQSREARKPVFIMLGLFLLAGAPFIWFVAQRIAHADLPVRFAYPTFTESLSHALYRVFDVKRQFHGFMGWLAVAGLLICFVRTLSFPRKRESTSSYALLSSYFLASFPMALSYQEMRYWVGPALFIFPLLGGVALGTAHEWIERIALSFPRKLSFPRLTLSFPRKRESIFIFNLTMIIIIFLASHVLFSKLSTNPQQVKTPTLVYLRSPDIWQHPRQVFSMKDKEKIAQLVRERVEPDEYFWVDYSNNLNNYIAASAGRSTVKSIRLDRKATSLVEGIKLVVAKENPLSQPSPQGGEGKGEGYVFLSTINKEYNAYILKNNTAAAKVKLPKPLVTTGQLRISFIAMAVLILINMSFPSPRESGENGNLKYTL